MNNCFFFNDDDQINNVVDANAEVKTMFFQKPIQDTLCK